MVGLVTTPGGSFGADHVWMKLSEVGVSMEETSPSEGYVVFFADGCSSMRDSDKQVISYR